MKNKIKFFSALFVMLGIVCIFTSCPWDEKPVVNYTITYVSDHGTTPDPIKVLSGTILNDSQLPILKEEGYTFLGWYENDVKVTANSYALNYDITLTAKWKANEVPEPEPEEVKYTVTFKTEYGTVPAKLEVLENTKLTKTDLKALTYDGYTFEGWYDEDDKLAEAGKFTVTKDVTLTAKWKANEVPKTDDDEDPEEGKDPADDEEVEKGFVGFTFEVNGFADFEIIATEDPDSKDITLSVAKKYDSYSWTIKTRSSTSTKTKKTITLTEADYKYGADILLVVQDGDNYYSAQYSIEVKESK